MQINLLPEFNAANLLIYKVKERTEQESEHVPKQSLMSSFCTASELRNLIKV